MKKIEAIVKPFKVAEVKDALNELGIEGMTLSEVRGFIRAKGRGNWRPAGEAAYLPKVKIEVVVHNDKARAAIATVVKSARNGKLGDDQVFVSDVEQAVRIRTEEKNEAAI